jgi:hypothetical protein
LSFVSVAVVNKVPVQTWTQLGRSTGWVGAILQGGLDWELATAQIPSISKGDPFEQAKEALATTTQPKSLPCRDKERAKIDNFVRNALHAGALTPLFKVLITKYHCSE